MKLSIRTTSIVVVSQTFATSPIPYLSSALLRNRQVVTTDADSLANLCTIASIASLTFLTFLAFIAHLVTPYVSLFPSNLRHPDISLLFEPSTPIEIFQTDENQVKDSVMMRSWTPSALPGAVASEPYYSGPILRLVDELIRQSE